MTCMFSSLYQIDHDHSITEETDQTFLFHFKHALLLALKEQGRLSETQYRRATDGLKQQRKQTAIACENEPA